MVGLCDVITSVMESNWKFELYRGWWKQRTSFQIVKRMKWMYSPTK